MFIIFILAAAISFFLAVREEDISDKFLIFCGSFIALFIMIAIGAMCWDIQFGGRLV